MLSQIFCFWDKQQSAERNQGRTQGGWGGWG